MQLIIKNLKIPIENDGSDSYLQAVAKEMGIEEESVSIVKILSKSLDIKNAQQFFVTISLVVKTRENFPNNRKFPQYFPAKLEEKEKIYTKDRPIIVGFGPAGMFAALELIDYGFKPLIFERGKEIGKRNVDIQKFIHKRELNPESNIQFGEGGAGSYSDGKLFSRRGSNTSIVNRVLQTFIKFGAPEEIAYISKPHLGTDVLCKIVKNVRHFILDKGGEILYDSKMTDLLISGGKACGVIINGEDEYLSSNIYLALGHSARETFALLHQKGVALEQRPISVGVRIEHPAETIDLMRYGQKYHKFPELGAATYSLNYTNKKIQRGVYTFCMCPGGEVVNASSEQGMLVLNGMSYSRRASPFSNAALAVTCHTNDYKTTSPLAGIEFQKAIERNAYEAGGCNWEAPAQNLLNFLGEKGSPDLPANSFKMGVSAADMRDIFPSFIIEELLAAFTRWKNDVPLFVSQNAILLGAETRTSSPVRIVRDENYESVNIKNLYPIGEGSGYSGGITSSAADAIKSVQAYVCQRHG